MVLEFTYYLRRSFASASHTCLSVTCNAILNVITLAASGRSAHLTGLRVKPDSCLYRDHWSTSRRASSFLPSSWLKSPLETLSSQRHQRQRKSRGTITSPLTLSISLCLSLRAQGTGGRGHHVHVSYLKAFLLTIDDAILHVAPSVLGKGEWIGKYQTI